METQNNQETKTKKSGFFTKISTKGESEKPLKSITNLFYVLGIINVIVVFVMALLKDQFANVSGWGLLFLDIIICLGFFYFPYRLKKHKNLSAAIGLFVFSILMTVMVALGVAGGGSNIIAVLLCLLALFSSIDAIMIIRQLEKLDNNEDTKTISE